MDTNMKNIRIQGHPMRGKEVIKAFEDLGGLNDAGLKGVTQGCCYYINDKGNIRPRPIDNSLKDFLTLEEYLNIKNNMKERTIKISLETAKQWYKSNNVVLEQMALSLFTEEELTRIEFPTSWEEFRKKYNKITNEWYVNSVSVIMPLKNDIRDSDEDNNLLETKTDAEAILALIQLKRLRDAWWKLLNYQPNWTNEEEKYCIGIYKNKIKLETKIFSSTFLAFPTQDICNQFFVSFQDLIQKAKPFLS